jgi:hypothetical protein
MALPLAGAEQAEIPVGLFGLWPMGAKLMTGLALASLAALLFGWRWAAGILATALTGLSAIMFWEDVAKGYFLRPWLGRYWEMMPNNPLFEEYSPAALYVPSWGWYVVIGGAAAILIGAVVALLTE